MEDIRHPPPHTHTNAWQNIWPLCFIAYLFFIPPPHQYVNWKKSDPSPHPAHTHTHTHTFKWLGPLSGRFGKCTNDFVSKSSHFSWESANHFFAGMWWEKQPDRSNWVFNTIEPGHEKRCLMPYANNKGADQPAHPRSLNSAFVVHFLDSIISLDSIAEISKL